VPWVLVDDLINEILIPITQNNNNRLFKVLGKDRDPGILKQTR
jgi:hypothetical protein